SAPCRRLPWRSSAGRLGRSSGCNAASPCASPTRASSNGSRDRLARLNGAENFMAALHRAWWKYGRAPAVPLLLWGLVIASLWEPIKVWLNSSRYHDRAALREWIENARGNLPGMVDDYVRLREGVQAPGDWKEWILLQQRQKNEKHPETRADPLTKFRPDQVRLFFKLFQQREKIEEY